MNKDLKFGNEVALDLLQAMLGAISPNIRAISYECISKKVIVYFIFEQKSDEDRDEAEDIICEFEALQLSGSGKAVPLLKDIIFKISRHFSKF